MCLKSVWPTGLPAKSSACLAYRFAGKVLGIVIKGSVVYTDSVHDEGFAQGSVFLGPGGDFAYDPFEVGLGISFVTPDDDLRVSQMCRGQDDFLGIEGLQYGLGVFDIDRGVLALV